MNIEVVKQNTSIDGISKVLWEIKIDGKKVEVVDFDPSELIEHMKENFIDMYKKWEVAKNINN